MNKIRFICLTLFILYVITNIYVFGQALDKRFEIVFEGNEKSSSQELRKVIDECELEFDSKEDFDDDDLILYEFRSCAKDIVLKFLKKKGFSNADVGNLSLKRKKDEVIVNIPIKEGLYYSFGQLSVEGATVLPITYFEQTFPVSYGEIVDIDLVRPWIDKKILKAYRDAGYRLQWIDYELRFRKVNHTKGIVDIALFVNEGNAYIIENIWFLGNEKTRDFKIRKHLELGKHDIFTEERLEYAIEKLNKADVVQRINFKRDVEIKYDASNLLVDILIKVKEKE